MTNSSSWHDNATSSLAVATGDTSITQSTFDVSTDVSLAGGNGTMSCDLRENLHFVFSGVIILFLNAIAIADICTNRIMRGSTKVLLVNLLTTDAVSSVFHITYWVTPCIRWVGACDMFLSVSNIHAMDTMALQVLCLSIFYITASRLLLLLKGPAFVRVARTWRALAVVIITWVLIICSIVTWVMFRTGSSYLNCLDKMSILNPHVIFVALTFLTVCPMNVLLMHLVRKRVRQVAAPHPAVQNLPRVVHWDNETRVNVAAIMVISCFCVCYLPGLYVLVVSYLGENLLLPQVVVDASLVLNSMHPLFDPLIYGWRLGRKSRRLLVLCRCNQQQMEPSTRNVQQG